MKKVLKIGIPVLVVLAGLAFAGWYFLLRDTAPGKASLDDLSSEPTTTASGGAGSSTSPPPATPDGSWTVQPADDVFVGYRVQEQFVGQTVKKTAAGRSPSVTGGITIAGNQVVGGEFAVDMTKLASDQSRRD